MMKQNQTTIKNFGFVRVATSVPHVHVGNIEANKKIILRYIHDAVQQDAAIVIFPELSITGYTLGDLFQQKLIQEQALRALADICEASKKHTSVIIVGLPLIVQNNLFNVAAVITKGKILGIVPKTHLPNYREFYEKRWFASSRDLKIKDFNIFGKKIPIGTNLLFRSVDIPKLILGIEICEDLWSPLPPSSSAAVFGANVLINLSASNELVGKADYRRQLVMQQSARTLSAYIYTSSGVHESTTDLVYGGHAIIAENGLVLQESRRFERNGQILYADIDIAHLISDRERTSSFGESMHESGNTEFRYIDIPGVFPSPIQLNRHIDMHPFVPQNNDERNKRAEEILSIQSAGLAKRLESAGIKKSLLGLSGGLDSTLALIVTIRAHNLLGLPLKNIRTFTMPGFGTSGRTKTNAIQLAQKLGVNLEEISINKGSIQQFKDIQHDGIKQDVTFENVQARYRTFTLMNKANQIGGLVVGTGDLSELALGWNTFTGDQISHYNVNAGVPKTLVRYLVEWASEQKEFKKAKDIFDDILATPVSPELIRQKDNQIGQKTEDIIGPYELHDFFLYHFIRWGSPPTKILFLAERAFGEKYSRVHLKKHLHTFIERFFKNQWKRSVMPDGPKVGSVSLSPRGDWRMPSDAEAEMWLKELNDA